MTRPIANAEHPVVSDEAGPDRPRPYATVTADVVEKAILGAAPDDVMEMPAAAVDPRAFRLETVRAFLAEQPELRAVLAREVVEAWQHADGKRPEYLAVLAERRAQVLSQAELHHLGRQASQSVSSFAEELSRYLVEANGVAADGPYR